MSHDLLMQMTYFHHKYITKMRYRATYKEFTFTKAATKKSQNINSNPSKPRPFLPVVELPSKDLTFRIQSAQLSDLLNKQQFSTGA